MNEIFDRAAALEQAADDESLLAELLEVFLGDVPRMVNEIRQAIDGKEADKLYRAAHSMKGSVSNFGSKAVAEAARELELMGRNNDLAGVEPAFSKLLDLIERFKEAVGPVSATAN
jgi:HPt (histidine-containing phosphotransfer) domain-containing protein